METLREVTKEIDYEAVTPQQERAKGWVVRVLLALLVVGLGLSFLVWNSGAESRSIRSLPVAERQALYARTVQNLTSVCVSDATSMRDFCEDQARMVKAFPECDDGCYRLAEKHLSRVQLPR